MNLLILGGSGRTGVHLLAQALERGHVVTALARNPAKLGDHASRIRVIKGDALDPASLAAAMRGQDAVLATLTSGTRAFKPVTFFVDSVRSITQAMRASGVTRLVYVTSGGVEKQDPVHGLVMRLVVSPLLRHVYDDMRRAENKLMSTELGWTIVRPPYLTDGPLTGKYRIAEKFAPPKGTQLSRADLAHFMLVALAPEYRRRVPSVAY